MLFSRGGNFRDKRPIAKLAKITPMQNFPHFQNLNTCILKFCYMPGTGVFCPLCCLVFLNYLFRNMAYNFVMKEAGPVHSYSNLLSLFDKSSVSRHYLYHDVSHTLHLKNMERSITSLWLPVWAFL